MKVTVDNFDRANTFTRWVLSEQIADLGQSETRMAIKRFEEAAKRANVDRQFSYREIRHCTSWGRHGDDRPSLDAIAQQILQDGLYEPVKFNKDNQATEWQIVDEPNEERP